MPKFYDVRLSDRKAGARQRCVNFSVEFCNGYPFTQLSLPSLLNYICPLVYNRFVYKQWQRSIRPYTCTSVTEFKNRSSATSIAQYRASIRHQQQIVKTTFTHLFPSYSIRKTYLSTADPFVISVVFHHPVDLRSHNSFFASTLQPIRPTPQTFGFAYALCVRAFHQSPPSTPTSPSRPQQIQKHTFTLPSTHSTQFFHIFLHSFLSPLFKHATPEQRNNLTTPKRPRKRTCNLPHAHPSLQPQRPPRIHRRDIKRPHLESPAHSHRDEMRRYFSTRHDVGCEQTGPKGAQDTRTSAQSGDARALQGCDGDVTEKGMGG